MKRALVVAATVIVAAVLMLLVVAELTSATDRLTFQPAPPGLVVDSFGGPRSLPSGWWYEKEGVSYEEVDNPRTVVAVVISTYRLMAFRYLFGYLELKPAPSFPNFELRIDSPELEGVGYGEDAIQCGDGQPASCSAWVYWSVRGNQIAEVAAYVDLFEGRMSADEFRDLVRSVLTIEGG